MDARHTLGQANHSDPMSLECFPLWPPIACGLASLRAAGCRYCGHAHAAKSAASLASARYNKRSLDTWLTSCGLRIAPTVLLQAPSRLRVLASSASHIAREISHENSQALRARASQALEASSRRKLSTVSATSRLGQPTRMRSSDALDCEWATPEMRHRTSNMKRQTRCLVSLASASNGCARRVGLGRRR